MAVGAAAASSKASSESSSSYNAGYSAGAANATSTANANTAAANANAAAANANAAAANAKTAAAHANAPPAAGRQRHVSNGCNLCSDTCGLHQPQSLGRWNLLFVRQHLVQSVLRCERRALPSGADTLEEKTQSILFESERESRRICRPTWGSSPRSYCNSAVIRLGFPSLALRT